MFPTTIWTRIHEAGDWNDAALEDFARKYRQPILQFIQSRGFRGASADDLCQDVFIRLLRGNVLAKADRDRGRFRSLVLAVTMNVIRDHARKRKEIPVEDPQPADVDEAFDHGWALHLAERAIERMREEGSPHYDILQAHLTGQKQDRRRLWVARRKLAEHIRHEVAETCATREDYEQELAYLSKFLRPGQKAGDTLASGRED